MREKEKYKIINGKRRTICCERGVFGIKHDCCKSNPQQKADGLFDALIVDKKFRNKKKSKGRKV